MTKLIQHAVVTIEEGLAFCNLSSFPEALYVGDKRAQKASGYKLFVAKSDALVCCHCGLKATKWILSSQSAKDRSTPVLNLFGDGKKGAPVLFTRDHIIPRMVGGNDDLENLRVMCGNCNHNRGSEVNDSDVEFALGHRHLIDMDRLQDTISKLKTRMVREPGHDMLRVCKNLLKMHEGVDGMEEICATIRGIAAETVVIIEQRRQAKLIELNA